MRIVLAGIEKTHQLGICLGKSLDVPSVLLLEGDLGAGKTSLVQGVGEGLGVSELIVSPTFTLINEYIGARCPLYHLDLYRISPSEVYQLSLETYWEGIETEPGITAIEWSEHMPYNPYSYIRLHFTQIDEDIRNVEISMCRYVLPEALSDFFQNKITLH
ncbi:ATPase YjeE, predicted to have essential role in cell wall biosynthesis [Richelia intracellularis HM01]|uniref:tRNA (adenosine(37)-N6)-threonylcarbamoyltransferase complex ATPase subunit type 1 TsaE n=1 Tax=Richelia intracellularis TaxID=1164990 RepID=UPI0002B5416E|nr:tRNA (adenosine(37)-N6)-threonylcarbamoyltransferase complex ATPase subunit type 1 TsaE [Richelia intracellularis]CCH64546.1 ATPase YjeE, predicted to have essential role in cell wall biosynthesis [Richelia intracellularis HM01]